MIQFPETAWTEWTTVSEAVNAKEELRKTIERGTKIEHEVDRLRIRHQAALAFQQELDADITPALEITTLTDYKNTPDAAPADLIDGVMKAEGLTIVLGASGSGKSTLALTMLHSLMSGDDWLDQQANQISGSVGIMSYDMDAAMLMNWMSGFPNIDSSKVSVVNAHKRGNPLAVPNIRKQIASTWDRMGVEVVVIDSFSASFFGHDQNDAASTMAHYRDMLTFSRECGAKALIMIVHSLESDPTKVRGSKVHHDVADSIVSVEGSGSDFRKVRMVKYREALGQQRMGPRVITPPDPVTHLVASDYGKMSLEAMPIPARAVAANFPDLPTAYEAPEPDSNGEEEEEEGEL